MSNSQADFSMQQKIPIRAYIIIILGAMFYFYEFAVRVAPAVLTQELMQSFSLNAVSLSALASLFYYAYILMQIPSGLLYDRFGPRRLLSAAIGICAIGILIFAITDQVWLAGVGRFMTGFGGAFAFVGVLVLAVNWFPARYFAIIAGAVQFLGSIGALVGEGPLAAANTHFGWHITLIGLFVMGLILGILFWFFVRDRPASAPAPERHRFGEGELYRLRAVLKNRHTWLIALYSFAIWTPMVVFPALWGVSYIRVLYHTTTAQAAEIVELVWLGVAFGSPLIGWWSEKIGRRNLPLAASALLGLIAILFILLVPMSKGYISILMVIFGLGASGQTLAFGVVKDNNTQNTIGTAIGFNNLCVVLGGVIILPMVGWLIKLGWDGGLLHGVPIYTLTEYRHAMYVIPISLVFALVISLFCLRETYCQSQIKS